MFSQITANGTARSRTLQPQRVLVSLIVSMIANIALFYLLFVDSSFFKAEGLWLGPITKMDAGETKKPLAKKNLLAINALPKRLKQVQGFSESSTLCAQGEHGLSLEKGEQGLENTSISLQKRLLGALLPDGRCDLDAVSKRVVLEESKQLEGLWGSLQESSKALPEQTKGPYHGSLEPVAFSMREEPAYYQLAGKIQEIPQTGEGAFEAVESFSYMDKSIREWSRDLLEKKISSGLSDWIEESKIAQTRDEATDQILEKKYPFLKKQGLYTCYLDLDGEKLLQTGSQIQSGEQARFFAGHLEASLSLSLPLMELFLSSRKEKSTLYLVPWIGKIRNHHKTTVQQSWRLEQLHHHLEVFAGQLQAFYQERTLASEHRSQAIPHWDCEVMSLQAIEQSRSLQDSILELDPGQRAEVIIWCDGSQLQETVAYLWHRLQRQSMLNHVEPVGYSVIIDLDRESMRAESLKALLGELDFLLFHLRGNWTVTSRFCEPKALFMSAVSAISRWAPRGSGELEVYFEGIESSPRLYKMVPVVACGNFQDAFEKKLHFYAAHTKKQKKQAVQNAQFALFQNEELDLLVTEQMSHHSSISAVEKTYLEMGFSLKQGKSKSSVLRLLRGLHRSLGR